MFRVVDAGIIRAVTHPDPLDLPAWPRLSADACEQVGAWLAWLTQVWSQPWAVEAVEVASPDLARQIGRLCNGHRPRPSEVRRVVVSLVRYLLRITSRPTPFGIFAGAAAVRFGPGPRARVGEQHATTTRVEAAWLEAVIARLESSPALMAAMPVVANNLAFVRGRRLVLGGHQRLDAAGRDAPVEVTVAYSAAVKTALTFANVPISLGVLADKVCAAFPAASRAKVEAMLRQLVSHRVLVSSLRPPTTVTDALGHVIDQAVAYGGERITAIAPILAQLRTIHTTITALDQMPLNAYKQRHERRRTIGQISFSITTTVPQRLAVTQRLDADVVLPAAVRHAVEAAAAALIRLAPRHGASPAWQHYHGRFVERYGPDTIVPVTELINPNTGLGFPAGFRDGPDEPTTGMTERDRKLLDLAQRAAITGTTEITLNDTLIADLGTEPDPQLLPPHTEISFQLHASDTEDLSTGDFTLAVATLSRHVGALTGRLLPVLHPADRERATTRASTGTCRMRQSASSTRRQGQRTVLRQETRRRTPLDRPALDLRPAHQPALRPQTEPTTPPPPRRLRRLLTARQAPIRARRDRAFQALHVRRAARPDKVNLDITWLRDESLADMENLPAPEVIAREIVEDLTAALAEFEAVAAALEAAVAPAP